MCHLTFIKLSKDAGGFMVDICGHYNFFGYLLMQVGVKDFYLICSTFIRRKYFHCFKNFLSFRNNMECCLGCLYYIYICCQKRRTMCPPGYYQSASGPMSYHAWDEMMRWVHELPWGTGRAHCLSFLATYILCSSYFCGIWALCVSWIT